MKVGTIECDVCLQAVSYMQKELLKNSTEVCQHTLKNTPTLSFKSHDQYCKWLTSQEAVLHALESFCSNRTDAGETCKRLLGEYFDTVWSLLIGGLV